jgi:hypothetical protein
MTNCKIFQKFDQTKNRKKHSVFNALRFFVFNFSIYNRESVMKKHKFPTLTKKSVTSQIIARTKFDSVTVGAVLSAYYDIMAETLLSGVEFQLPNIGRITFKDVKPIPAGERWHPALKQRIYMLAKQGYYKLDIKAEKDFKSKLKRRTLYGDHPTMEEKEEWVKSIYGDNAKVWTTWWHKKDDDTNGNGD